MNFVINIPGDRVVGALDAVYMRAGSPDGDPHYSHHREDRHAPLHYLEYRNDLGTGKSFVAIVYELPGVQ